VSEKEKSIAIYYEHPEWFRPLFAELERRRVPFTKLDAAEHFFDPHASPNYTLFFNRMSASAYLRGNESAIFYTRYLLKYLENKGIRVINGFESFSIETSKALQLSLLDSLGIKHPASRVVNSPAQVLTAAADLNFPVIFKPNIGGRGTGIIRFDSGGELEQAVNTNQIDLGPDSTALVQEFVPKRGGCIQRIETLAGKFLYGIRIYTPDENFNLCPAEVCLTENQPAAEICLVDGPKNGLRIEKFEPPSEIVEAVERIVAAAKIDVGGIEYLIDDRTGDAIFYDINALSNFVADSVNILGFDPHKDLVDFLEKEIELCATVTGSRFSAVG
jgi:hypothetical protein